jgi:hypothetical protein
MQRISRIAATLRHSKYSHTTRVDEKAGSYEFDCSAMVAWLLRRTSPVAYRAVRGKRQRRLVARDFYHHIARAKPGKARWGWQRVPGVADAVPGDVIAWVKPKNLRSKNTGHVAFIVEVPQRVPGVPYAYLVRIADASSYQHQDDSRRGTGRTGFGFGTILIMSDPQSDAPSAYGWVGWHSRWVFETRIAIGRATR